MKQGWIKIHRKLLECDIWDSDEPYSRRDAWIELLLLANHSDKEIIFDNRKITIQRGQYLTSVRKLSARWHWGKDKTLNYLRLLEECEMIKKESDTRRTLLTIVNYEIYQAKEDEEQTVSRHSADSGQTLDRHSPATNKNDKECNKNDKKHIYGEYKHVRLTDKQLDKLKADYGERETLEAIKYLDEYIQMKGYKANDHNLCMRKWVYDAVKRDKKVSGTYGQGDTSNTGTSQEEREREIEEYLKSDEYRESLNENLWDDLP